MTTPEPKANSEHSEHTPASKEVAERIWIAFKSVDQWHKKQPMVDFITCEISAFAERAVQTAFHDPGTRIYGYSVKQLRDLAILAESKNIPKQLEYIRKKALLEAAGVANKRKPRDAQNDWMRGQREAAWDIEEELKALAGKKEEHK